MKDGSKRKRIRNINPITGHFLTLLKKKGNERKCERNIETIKFMEF